MMNFKMTKQKFSDKYEYLYKRAIVDLPPDKKTQDFFTNWWEYLAIRLDKDGHDKIDE